MKCSCLIGLTSTASAFLAISLSAQCPLREYHLKLEVAVRSCCRASSPDMARHRHVQHD
mgnify:FL=1